ncbi:S10 family serine carboxypeptidase-like protein [Endozoicomonas sp. NE40]|uniref:Carboxypeptidase C (Cathepsin A) n=1 Tax=Endozoicomonas lisbonensis TaxID=3120522 RepID=A0ABV2SNZ6_9GAMM
MKTLCHCLLSFCFWAASVVWITPLRAAPLPTPPPIKIPTPGEVIGLPGLSQIMSKQYAGQVKVSDCGNYIFFWFFESQSLPTDPVVVWLNGGPGASSMIGLFTENGPIMLENSDTGGLAVKAREASWNKNAHYLVIDQPAGTGLSFSAKPDSCQPTNETESTKQLYTALQQIFTVLPQFQKNPLYIFGESFAGHYIPHLGKYIIDANAHISLDKKRRTVNNAIHLNLKGLGIGDGWIDPEFQTKGMADFAYFQGLVTEPGRDQLKQVEDRCTTQLAKYNTPAYMNGTQSVPASVADLCDAVINQLVAMTGKNEYNLNLVHKYRYDDIYKYLNTESVREALHVSTSTPPWTIVNNKIGSSFKNR